MVVLSDIIGDNKVEKVVTGFQFTEGPVWVPEGFLLFSDIPADTIYKYKPGSEIVIFLRPSGHSNGLTLDKMGRLVKCEHDRRVSRIEKDGKLSVLAEYYMGKRLNSPNDIVVKSDESIYFTDPSFGLPNRVEGKELDFCGVYLLEPDCKITLLDSSLSLPNGLAFSPDESSLYVDDSSNGHVYVFDVSEDGLLSDKRLFADVGGDEGRGGDGLKVDVEGNVFVTGPEGVNVFSPDGSRIGVIECPEKPSNLAWGDNDYMTLYITARTSIYRIRLLTGGSSLIPNFEPSPVCRSD